uniref:Thioredoxin-like_fold domain-containing protein n=1 Tax=Caenorhabditis tropicalis TaxID=1561998 RepID=A0A1I7TSK0_9PELO
MQSVLNLGKTTVSFGTFLRSASTSLQGKGPLKTNWKENVVYLYQFPRPANRSPNLSPFCLKIETFLRANRIKHEVIGTWLTLRQSPRGLLPFIELNGQQISDSQVIVWKLQKHFELDDKLEGNDRGTARAVERMMDVSTNYALLVDKTVNNAHLLLSRQVSNLPLPGFITNYLAKGFSNTARKRVNGVLGKLDVTEQKELLRRDIRAIDDILGDKSFYLVIESLRLIAQYLAKSVLFSTSRIVNKLLIFSKTIFHVSVHIVTVSVNIITRSGETIEKRRRII